MTRLMYTSTVTRKGQITLPKAICERLGIKRGDIVELAVENGHMYGKKVGVHGVTGKKALQPAQTGKEAA
jgi:AbrB family looped-hinge helix DNA binding protein